jgi:hypothetical protein
VFLNLFVTIRNHIATTPVQSVFIGVILIVVSFQMFELVTVC